MKTNDKDAMYLGSSGNKEAMDHGGSGDKKAMDQCSSGDKEAMDNGGSGDKKAMDHCGSGNKEAMDHGGSGDKKVTDHGSSGGKKAMDHGGSGDKEAMAHGGSGDKEAMAHGGSGDKEAMAHGGSGDKEAMEDGGSGGPPPPCVACASRCRSCGPDCVMAPFFPPSSEADFVNVCQMYGGEDKLTEIVTDLEPEMRDMYVTFMINQARIRADSSIDADQRRRLSTINSTRLFEQKMALLIRLAAEQPPGFRPAAARVPPTANLQDSQEAGGSKIGGPVETMVTKVAAGKSTSSGASSLPPPAVSEGQGCQHSEKND